jgi:hypothetical protein
MLRGTGIAKRGFGRALSRTGYAEGGNVEDLSTSESFEKLEDIKDESTDSPLLNKAIKKIKKHLKDNVKFVTPSPKFKKGGKVEKVMHEFKTGALHSGSKKGPVVKSRKQAIAIALSEQRKAKGKK